MKIDFDMKQTHKHEQKKIPSTKHIHTSIREKIKTLFLDFHID